VLGEGSSEWHRQHPLFLVGPSRCGVPKGQCSLLSCPIPLVCVRTDGLSAGLSSRTRPGRCWITMRSFPMSDVPALPCRSGPDCAACGGARSYEVVLGRHELSPLRL